MSSFIVLGGVAFITYFILFCPQTNSTIFNHFLVKLQRGSLQKFVIGFRRIWGFESVGFKKLTICEIVWFVNVSFHTY